MRYFSRAANFIFEKNFGARAHFLHLSLWKKCHFSKNAQKSKCSCARAWWRAPQKFYERARQALFPTPQKFWRARALTCHFIEIFESLPPLRKNRIFWKFKWWYFWRARAKNFKIWNFKNFHHGFLVFWIFWFGRARGSQNRWLKFGFFQKMA